MTDNQKLVLDLLSQPRTLQDILAISGIRERTARDCLLTLKRRGLIHIAAKRGCAAVYAQGAGNETPFRRDVHDELVESWFRQPVNVVVRRDPLVAALFGHSRA